MTESTENTQSYDEMFANRFTAEDEEYQKYVNRPADPPPIVEEWRGRGGGHHRGRDYRYHDRRGQDGHGGHGGYGGYGRGGGGGGGRGWGGDQRGNYRGPQHGGYDRDRHDRDRQWGHGSGHQSGHRGSNQGYSSDRQRFPKDCY